MSNYFRSHVISYANKLINHNIYNIILYDITIDIFEAF